MCEELICTVCGEEKYEEDFEETATEPVCRKCWLIWEQEKKYSEWEYWTNKL